VGQNKKKKKNNNTNGEEGEGNVENANDGTSNEEAISGLPKRGVSNVTTQNADQNSNPHATPGNTSNRHRLSGSGNSSQNLNGFSGNQNQNRFSGSRSNPSRVTADGRRVCYRMAICSE
jgi:hypothetical protein